MNNLFHNFIPTSFIYSDLDIGLLLIFWKALWSKAGKKPCYLVCGPIVFTFKQSAAGSVYFPVCSPSLNLAVIYDFLAGVNLDLSAQPIFCGCDRPASMLTLLTTGTSVACPSSCSAYSMAASNASWCLPQSKCCIMVECLKNVFVHPSSGHVNSPSADGVDSSSVLTWAAEAQEPFEWVEIGRLFTAEENELGCAWMTVIDGSPPNDGMSNLCRISLPVPSPYALNARIPSLHICIFERALTPSILYWTTGELTMYSSQAWWSWDALWRPPSPRGPHSCPDWMSGRYGQRLAFEVDR